MVAAIGCGSSSSSKSGTGGSGTGGSATGGTGGTGTGGSGTGGTGTGGSNGTGGSGVQSTEFSFSVNPTALMLPLGGMQALTVTINRDVGSTTFTGPLTFELDLPSTITGSGVTATFAPNPATAGSTTLTVNVGTTGIATGSYSLNVVATSGTGAAATQFTVALPLKVTSAASTLLVDNDASPNNSDPTNTTATASTSDTLFTTLLTNESIAYQPFIVPSGAPTTSPTTADLKNYSTIVWYTGANYGGDDPTLSDVQEAILADWLDQGGHTLLMFSEDLVYDRKMGDWDTTAETDDFLANYIGAMGDADDGDLNHVTYTASGVAGTAFASESFKVVKDSPIPSTGDIINPTTGANPPVKLVTVMSDPDGTGTPIATAIAVGRKNVGAAGTSTIVYVGMPIEDILMTTGNNSAADFFHATLVYAGLKTQ